MARPHLTLYGQVLLWFFLNLTLVAAVLFFVLKIQFRVDPRELLGSRTREQFRAAASVMSGELRNSPRVEWEQILERCRCWHFTSFARIPTSVDLPIKWTEVADDPSGDRPYTPYAKDIS